MVDVKARATGARVARFLNGIEGKRRRRDCKVLSAMMRQATGPANGCSAVSPRASALTLYLLIAESVRRIKTDRIFHGG